MPILDIGMGRYMGYTGMCKEGHHIMLVCPLMKMATNLKTEKSVNDTSS